MGPVHGGQRVLRRPKWIKMNGTLLLHHGSALLLQNVMKRPLSEMRVRELVEVDKFGILDSIFEGRLVEALQRALRFGRRPVLLNSQHFGCAFG